MLIYYILGFNTKLYISCSKHVTFVIIFIQVNQDCNSFSYFPSVFYCNDLNCVLSYFLGCVCLVVCSFFFSLFTQVCKVLELGTADILYYSCPMLAGYKLPTQCTLDNGRLHHIVVEVFVRFPVENCNVSISILSPWQRSHWMLQI